MRSVFSRIQMTKPPRAVCQTFIFTDTEMPLQSREPKCQDITRETAHNCVLEKMTQFHNCPLKNTYQFGTCNPVKLYPQQTNNEFAPNLG